MGTAFLYGNGGGSGGSLNFSVKTYTTEEALLAAAPRENTVGVVTNTAVPKWGFSASEPSAPAEGEIWFSLGTEGDAAFNALKKNRLEVYPISCKQFISGVWELRIAYIYKSGAWVQFSDLATYLYRAPIGAIVPFIFSKESNSTVTIGTDAIVTDYTSSSSSITAVRTENTVDLTNFSVLCFRAKTTAMRTDNAAYTPVFCICNRAFTQADRKSAFQATVDITADSAEKVYTIDISAITGSYYVGAWGIHKSEIYEIYLKE